MSTVSPRLAARAIILRDDKLLIVNAWKGNDRLWCAPGGGVERNSSLPDNLKRELFEETGLTISVGAPCLINEFHDPPDGFHQVEVFFRCEIISGDVSDDWKDPEGVVSKRRWITRADAAGIVLRPASLADVAWGDANLGAHYDNLEPILR